MQRGWSWPRRIQHHALRPRYSSSALPSGPPRCRLIVLGPPGGGKGTQSVRLVEQRGFAMIGMGDILRRSESAEVREHISRGGAPLASSPVD